jgi:hypothetical protein
VQEAIFAHKQTEGVENSQWPRKKCTRQFALNAVRNAKSHSSLTRVGQFTAENAGQRKDLKEVDTKPLTLNN